MKDQNRLYDVRLWSHLIRALILVMIMILVSGPFDSSRAAKTDVSPTEESDLNRPDASSSAIDQEPPASENIKSLLVGFYVISPYVLKFTNQYGELAHVSALRISESPKSSEGARFIFSFYITGHDGLQWIALVTEATVLASDKSPEEGQGERLIVTLEMKDISGTELILPGQYIHIGSKIDVFTQPHFLTIWGPLNQNYKMLTPQKMIWPNVHIAQLKKIDESMVFGRCTDYFH